MATKRPHTAICPFFVSRVDYGGISWIQCKQSRAIYHSRKERDAVYMSACCNDVRLCPVTYEDRINFIYPIFDAIEQEARNHDRK